MSHLAQAPARLAPAAPAEEEEHGQGDAYEGCQRRCRCVPTSHARRLIRFKVPRTIGDVADSAVRPGGPWLAQHAIHVRARRFVGRGRIGAAPQIGAAIRQSFPRSLALGPDRAWLARHIASGGFAVVVGLLTLAISDACRALVRHGKLWALLARASIDLVDQRLEGVDATRNSQASRAPRTHWASLTVTSGAEVSGVRVRAFAARPCRTGAHWAVRPGLAGNARLLSIVGLVRAGGAFVTEGSARGGRNEASRAVPAVGWVGAPTNRIGLPRSARLARCAAVMATVWVESAGGARRERLPQARRSFCRTKTTAGTVAALGRADIIAQLARRAHQTACASLVRVVGPGRARKAACLRQAGDPDGEWSRTCIRAELAPAIALATALVVGLDRRVTKVASRARVRTAGEVHWGQGQRRWSPQTERAVNGSIYSQLEHAVGWARGLGRGERHIP
eukprot:scaffold61261_cov66-Phaeocystis_antarctica.AAC.4